MSFVKDLLLNISAGPQSFVIRLSQHNLTISVESLVDCFKVVCTVDLFSFLLRLNPQMYVVNFWKLECQVIDFEKYISAFKGMAIFFFQ